MAMTKTNPLTPAQDRYLKEIREAGEKVYNGRAFKPLERLEELELIEVDWDLVKAGDGYMWSGRRG